MKFKDLLKKADFSAETDLKDRLFDKLFAKATEIDEDDLEMVAGGVNHFDGIPPVEDSPKPY